MSDTKTYLDGLLGNQATIQTTGVTNPNNGNPNLINNQPQTTKDTNDNPHPGVTFTNTNFAQQISTPTAAPNSNSMVDDILNRIRTANPFGTPSGTNGAVTPPTTTPPVTTPGTGTTNPPLTNGSGGSQGTNPLDPNRYQLNNTYWNEILNRQINAPGGPQGGLPSGLDMSNLTQGSFGNLNWDSLNQVAQEMGLGNFKTEGGGFDWRQLLDAITEPFIQGDFWDSVNKRWTIPQGLAGALGGPAGEYIYKKLEQQLLPGDMEDFEIPKENIDFLQALREERSKAMRNELLDSFARSTGVDLTPATREELFAELQRQGWSASLNPETMTQQQAQALTRFFDLYRQGGLQRASAIWGQGFNQSGVSGTGSYDAPTIEEFLRNFTTADGGAAPMTPEQWEAMMRYRRGEVRR